MDGRKQPIRGLWKRGDRYYARLSFEDPTTGAKEVRRVPLLDKETDRPVETLAAAVKAFKALETDERSRLIRRTPKFNEFVPRFLGHYRATGDKRESTVEKLEGSLRCWLEHLGDTRLDKIRLVQMNTFIADRRKSGRSPRTCNLDIIALRQCLKHAKAEGWIRFVPEMPKSLKTTQTTRPLFTAADIEALCAAALDPAYLESRLAKKGENGKRLKNGPQFVDYIRFLQYSGARRSEALRVRWTDVDFDSEQVTIGADGSAKNRKARVVDFNPQLKALLEDIRARSPGDSQWVFPSPQRGDRDIPAKSFQETLKLARLQAAKTRPNLARFGFHDCRHHFISMAVMANIDFMTVAKWVGHQDGGVLIGKVYGHLADEHRKAMAQRLTFVPMVVEEAEAS